MLVGKTVVALKNTVYISNLSFLSVFCVEDPIVSYITHLVNYTSGSARLVGDLKKRDLFCVDGTTSYAVESIHIITRK